MNAQDLVDFEQDIADRFERGEVKGPIHLSSGNEDQLVEIFKDIKREDWVFSTYRSHMHALLHGVPAHLVRSEIIAGRSMNLKFPQHRFFTSAIVGGCLPIAVGVASAIKRQYEDRHVWCFVGDMCASTGAFSDAQKYSAGNNLPITFVVEDNALSVNTPTRFAWAMEELNGPYPGNNILKYTYSNTKFAHWGVKRGRSF